MVIINTDAWEDPQEAKKRPPSIGSDASSERLFGFQDLASDYYQVLRQRSRPKVCRILWGIIVGGFMVVTFWMVYRLVQDYLQFNSFNSASTEWKSNVTLPAITVCGTNFVNYTALKAALEDSSYGNGTSGHLMDDFDSVMDLLAKYDGSESIFNSNTLDWVAFDELLNWEYYEGSIATNYENSIDSMIIGQFDYSFANKGTNIKNTAEVTLPTELGICFEINDNGNMQQSYNGVNGGFTIDLDANVNDYLPTTATKGFVVYIRDQDESVMLNQGGYIISPGSETFMKLTARSVTRLEEPYGTCKDTESQYSRYDSTHYETIRECIQRQKIQLMIEECWCIPWYFANRMYTLKKTDILTEAVRTIEELRTIYYSDISDPPTEVPTSGPTEEPVNSQDQDINKKKRSHSSQETRGFKSADMSARRLLHLQNAHKIKKRSPNMDNIEGNTKRNTREADMMSDDAGTNYTSTAPPSNSRTTNFWDNWGTSSVPWWVTDAPISSWDDYQWVCNFVEQQVCHNTLEFYLKEGSFQLEDCQESCAYNEWTVETSSTIFPPTEEYYDRFIKEYIEKEPNFEYARSNIARLHIYYDDIKITKIEQEKAYEIQNVIAEFGGTVDLFIGFSFFTIIQLIEILIAWVLYRCCRRGNKNPGESKVVENTAAQGYEMKTATESNVIVITDA